MASTDTPPRRRFLPQPVETSTRSSKRQHLDKPEDRPTDPSTDADVTESNMATVKGTKPKRFLPQPIEETTRSSRRKNAEKEKVEESGDYTPKDASMAQRMSTDDTTHPRYPTSRPSGSTRRFAPEPVETTTRSSRQKFAVEPVETTTRHSKDKSENDNAEESSARARRKFAPEPVETTTRSSKDKPQTENESTSSKPRRKFAVEPVETSTVRRRRKDQDEDSNESPPSSPSDTSSRASSRQSTGSRRFSPELLETAKGSYRHRKDPDSPRSSQQSVNTSSPPLSRATTKSTESDEPQESRFSAASLARRCHEEHRRHSYCIPNLPIIESESSSDESSPPSLTESPSSTDNEHHKLGAIEEEESKDSYTDYVLSLTTSQEKKRLQDQMMAAYINEVPYEPVAHFAADEEDDLDHVGTLSGADGADPRTFRRSSQDEHDWEMQEMRRHHEQLEKAKKELHDDTAGVSRFSAAALAARHHLGQVHKTPAKTEKQKDEDAEFANMKKAASPPMLGGDLVFPYTVSPKMTRCDVDQAPRPRRANSDDDDDAMSVDSTSQQLWSSQKSAQNTPNAGLWMGMCQKSEFSRPTTPTRSGLQTPAFEMGNPFDSHTPRGARTPGRKGPRPYSGMHLLPMTPPRSTDGSQDEFTSSIDKKLQLEKQIEEEFTPRVITQIYNYLSLGFPSLARDFDFELSKISRIPVKELRKDDQVFTGTIKGYVGAPESDGSWEEDDDGTVRGCRRWEALRL